jgi:hypothetical protein
MQSKRVLCTPQLQLFVQVGGVDFEAMLESAMGGRLDVGKPLLDVESGDDAITVYLE